MIYTVNNNLKHNGTYYPAGETLEAEPATVAQLVEDGIITPADGTDAPAGDETADSAPEGEGEANDTPEGEGSDQPADGTDETPTENPEGTPAGEDDGKDL